MREASRLVPFAALLLGVLGSVSAPARAGSIEVLVRERDGAVVPRQAVDLLRVEPERDLEAPRLFGMAFARATTDGRGRALFEGIPPGSYTAAPRSITNPAIYFASPDNPLRSVGAATLVNPEDSGTLEIVLDRGTWVSFETFFDGTPFPRGLRVRMERPGSPSSSLLLDDAGRGTTQLSAGDYVFVLEHPPGLALARVEVDGEPVDPLRAGVAIETPSSTRHVTFVLQAPCKVLGTVVSTRIRPGVEVEATLVRAGTSAPVPRVVARPDDRGDYVLFLPDGVWSIRPVGESLLDSVPPEASVTLAVGQEGRANFSVREKEPGDEARLLVVVSDPDGRRVPSARVEVWRADDLHPKGAPVASVTGAQWGGGASVAGLPSGSYRVLAGARGYASASEMLLGFDAEAGADRRLDVTLRRGATVRARAVDEAGKPVAGIVLRIASQELPAIDGFSAEGSLLCTGARAHASPTDREGRLELRGVAPGPWTAKAEAPDGTAIVEVAAGGGARGRESQITLVPDEIAEVDLRVVRAASLSASLRCSDRGPVPERVATQVLRGAKSHEVQEEEGRPAEDVAFERTCDLNGEKRDRLTIGPLEAGDVVLAVKPEGFDAWTFSPGVESGEEAVPIHVEHAQAADAGTVVLRCEPAVEIVLFVRSKQPLPDLARSEVRATWVPDPGPGAPPPSTAPAEIGRERIVIRPLPTGTGRLDVSVRHPFFLPDGEVRGSFPLTLARGRLVPAPLSIAAIGGAIVARGGIAARLRTPRGESRLEPAERGAVSFPALPPGSYGVDVCADTKCVRVLRSFDLVAVAAGATSEVDAAAAQVTREGP